MSTSMSIYIAHHRKMTLVMRSSDETESEAILCLLEGRRTEVCRQAHTLHLNVNKGEAGSEGQSAYFGNSHSCHIWM